jgi:hypothetical protein
VIAVVVGVLVVAAVVGVEVWRGHRGNDLSREISLLPSGIQRVSWTDWAGVRRAESADLSAGSSGRDVERFLSRAFDDDLSASSALPQSARTLQERFGFSPASLDWELFAQSDQGAVIVMSDASADFTDLAVRLADLGFKKPASDDGVWLGGSDLLSGIGSGLTPELGYVALDEKDHLILTSDTAVYLQAALDARAGHVDRATGLDGVARAVHDPLAAEVYSGEYACGALAMAHADASDQAQGSQLVAAAGKVNPYSAIALALEPGRRAQVTMEFESDDQARTNADTRAVLARGAAPGQGGTFGDRFGVRQVTASGSLVTMDLVVRPRAFMISDLASGPVLFATC